MMNNIIIYILCVVSCKIAAQDILTTPTGVELDYYVSSDILELSENEDLTLWNEYYSWHTSNESESVLLRGPSRNYNCAAYAYYMSTGGEKVIYLYSVQPYISGTNPTYYPSTIDDATKIEYYEDYHSGVLLDDSIVISKWGWWPLMMHHYKDCPYYDYGDEGIVFYKRYDDDYLYLDHMDFPDELNALSPNIRGDIIHIDDLVIEQNAIISIEGGEKVIIDSNFEIQLGAELKINKTN